MIFWKPLDRRDLLPLDLTDANRAGPYSLSIYMDCAGPAFPNAATVLGALEIQVIPENPKQGRVIGNIHSIILTVDIKRNHDSLLSSKQRFGL
jgi:hypothetical protein